MTNIENARFIEVSAEVRYWEDATINGNADIDGGIPLRCGLLWEPTIELSTGRVINWPDDVEAKIHYKICDLGEYWLLDGERKRIAKWKGRYVPDDFLCVGNNGYGNYIILKIGKDGLIVGWDKPEVDGDKWDAAMDKKEEDKCLKD